MISWSPNLVITSPAFNPALSAGLPEAILKKPSTLTIKEYNLVKKQRKKSLGLIQHLKIPDYILKILMHQHEKYDGTGYPEGLKGEDIPLESRILYLASAFEAMRRERPYRGKIKLNEAVEEIKRNRGRQFDEKAVDAFLRVINREDIIKEISKPGK